MDLRATVRALLKRPTYFIVSVETLALVIGANTAIFAVVNATFLQRLPFVDGDRVAVLYALPPGLSGASNRNPLHRLDFIRFRERLRSFTQIEGSIVRDRVLTGPMESEMVRGAAVSAGLFQIMGQSASIGRVFTRDEDRPGQGVVVLSHAFWERRFGADPRVLGTVLTIDGVAHEVLGVTQPSFPPAFLESDLLTPLAIDEGDPTLLTDRSTLVRGIGVLADGVTLAAADLEVRAVMTNLSRETPAVLAGWTAGAVTFREWWFGDLRLAIVVLMGAVLLVLLIGCANVANLTLAQAVSRRGERALRLSLGATRRDLVRLQLTESLVISCTGGAIGLAVAAVGVPALLAINPEVARTLGPVGTDGRVIAFTIAIAGAAAIASGLLPAIKSMREDASGALADINTRTAGSAREGRMRGALVAAQTALCLTILISGAMLVRHLEAATRTHPGFNPEGVLTAQLRLPASYTNAEQRGAIVEQLLGRIRALPGVAAAGTTMNEFRPGSAFVTLFDIEHRPTADGQAHTTQFRRISPGYFKTLQIREVRGRTFTEQDRPSTPPVAVVSRKFASKFWPGEDAIGRRIRRGGPSGPWVTIVGIVEDVSDVGFGQPQVATLYIPWGQNNVATAPVGLVIRTASDPVAITSGVRAAVASVDRNIPVDKVQTLEHFLSASLAPQRFRTALLAGLAALGLLVAASGIYGVTARGVMERKREFGVRMALGAAPRGVLQLVVGQALRAVTAGTVVGLVGAYAMSRLITRLLPDVAAADPWTGGVAALVLLLTAAAAATIPARRVLRLDPVVALRAD